MAQDPFDRQEFQRKLDAIARQTTGDQFRLNTKDPQASEKFGSFLADEQESFGQQNQPEARPDIGSFFGSGIIENLGRGATGIGRYLQENSPLTREGGFTAGEGISGGLRQSISGLGPNFAAAAPGVEPFIPESFVKGEGFERGLREGIRGFSHPQELLITAETAGIGPGVAAAIRGGGSSTFRNIAAKLLEPVSGGFGRRAGFEGGAGLGANIGGSVVQETLPEDTSTPVRLAATLAGGLVGGGVGAVGGNLPVYPGHAVIGGGFFDADQRGPVADLIDDPQPLVGGLHRVGHAVGRAEKFRVGDVHWVNLSDVAGEKWQVENGKSKVASRKWQVESGKSKVADGNAKVATPTTFAFPFCLLPYTTGTGTLTSAAASAMRSQVVSSMGMPSALRVAR